MNALSWLIYLADVSSSIDRWAFAVVILMGGCVAVAFSHNAETGGKRWDEAMANHVLYPGLYKKPTTDRPSDNYPFRKHIRFFVGVAIGSIVVSTAVPSKNTLYAIAASELGEAAMKSSAGTKAIKALDAWLDQQIERAQK